jgi:hypothetical protein
MSDTLVVLDEPSPNLWQRPPDPESRSPAADHDHGAPNEAIGLGGTTEETNTPAPKYTQAPCLRCGRPFTLRNDGGSPQRYCSPACRKAFNANPSVATTEIHSISSMPLPVAEKVKLQPALTPDIGDLWRDLDIPNYLRRVH